MISPRRVLAALWLSTLVGSAAACAGSSAAQQSARPAYNEQSRFQGGAGDTHGGRDMPGKGRAGEHKFMHAK